MCPPGITPFLATTVDREASAHLRKLQKWSHTGHARILGAVSMHALLELLTSSDRASRDQGLELARALGADAIATIGTRLFNEGRARHTAVGSGQELLSLLSEAPVVAAGIRSLPPISLDANTDSSLLLSFESLDDLMLIWRGSSERLSKLLRRLPRLRRLALLLTDGGEVLELPASVQVLHLWTHRSVPVVYGKGLVSFSLDGHFSTPPILTTLPRGLRVLRLPRDQINPIDLAHFDRLEEARLPTSWAAGQLRLRGPLKRLHLGRCEGGLPKRPPVGSQTVLRVDRWYRPDRAAAGDGRLQWVGFGDNDPQWPKLIYSFRQLAVVDPGDTEHDVPSHLLAAPSLLWERGATERERRQWAARGCDYTLQAELPTARYIELLRRARALFGMGIRDAKVAITAARDGRMTALSLDEAHAWAALFLSAEAGVCLSRLGA